MKLNVKALFCAAMLTIVTAEPLLSQRRGGGGRGGGGFRGGGGMSRGGGGFRGGGAHFSRAAARPSISRPAARPAVTPRPTAPSMSNFRSNVGRPATPATRPSIPATRPTTPAARQPARDVGRPGRPDIGQPGRPDVGRPGRPSDRPRPSNPIYNNRPINNWDIDVDNGWGSGWGCCAYGWGAAAAGAAAGYWAAEAWDDDDIYYGGSVGSVTYVLPSECSVQVVNGITYQQCGSTWYEPQFVGDQVSYIVVSPPQ